MSLLNQFECLIYELIRFEKTPISYLSSVVIQPNEDPANTLGVNSDLLLNFSYNALNKTWVKSNFYRILIFIYYSSVPDVAQETKVITKAVHLTNL